MCPLEQGRSTSKITFVNSKYDADKRKKQENWTRDTRSPNFHGRPTVTVAAFGWESSRDSCSEGPSKNRDLDRDSSGSSES
jgi:hypothetical protein